MRGARQWLLGWCATLAAGLAFADGLAAPAAARADTRTLRAGERVDAALAALNAQGFHVVYSSALVRPDMTLQSAPTSSRIEELLPEILAPWNLRAVRAANGDWLIALAAAPTPATQTNSAAEDISVIDVTATRLRLAVTGVSETFLSRKDVERMPHLADDAMRMLKVMPGVTGGDFSAALNIRGGRREEALLTIDGAEIHNGFHFRDIDGAFSVLDTHLVEGIDFITGGMTADLGDHMSGSVGLQSRRPTPEDDYHNGVGVSFVSAYGRSSGTYADGEGWWLLSARRGFLDELAARVMSATEQLTPRYTDVFAGTGFDLDEHTTLNARFLFSSDELVYVVENRSNDTDSAGKGRSMNLWFTLDHEFPGDLHTQTLVSAASVNLARDSRGSDAHRAAAVHDDDDFRFLDLRQDWSWTFSENQQARWGVTFGQQHGDYDYSLLAQLHDPLITPVPIDTAYGTNLGVNLRKTGVYAAWRARLAPDLTTEAGLRWDDYRYDHGLEFEVVSPRLNAVYRLGDRDELRAAWGVVYQPQAVNELQVEDNVSTFFRPERVQQATIGYTHHFMPGFSARVDLYDKRYSNLRPRFENALDPLQLIPESAPDRVRIDAPVARARGVEFTLRHEAERGLAGWASLAVARAEDFDGGVWRARSWEQRLGLSFGSSWTGVHWNASLTGLLHGGMPTTSIGIVSTPLPGGGYTVDGLVGERNGARFGSYARIDLRVNRDVLLAQSKMSFYLEVTNLLDRKNECCIDDYGVAQDGQGVPFLDVKQGYWFPLLPSLGFQWEF